MVAFAIMHPVALGLLVEVVGRAAGCYAEGGSASAACAVTDSPTNVVVVVVAVRSLSHCHTRQNTRSSPRIRHCKCTGNRPFGLRNAASLSDAQPG